MISNNIFRWIRLGVFLFLTIVLAGCASPKDGCDPESDGTLPSSNSEMDSKGTSTPQDPETIQSLWQDGSHADTYITADDNTNSTCASCHSPLNWSPIKADLPAAWVDHQLEAAQQAAYISKLDWSHVDCTVCHSPDGALIEGAISWLEIPPLGMYSEVVNSNQLCQKCHLEGKHEGHHALSLGGVHGEFLCIDCHNAHSTVATCGSSSCHEPFGEECENIDTHDKPHSQVTCSACHEGGETEIKWNEELLAWDTYRLNSRNSENYEPFVSHNIVLKVDCDRCHSPGDHPWDPQ